MRSVVLGVAVCSALALGCSRRDDGQWHPPAPGTPGAVKAPPAAKPRWDTSIEANVARQEDAEDRANYLKSLGKDPKFDPKQHKPMLEKYSNAPEPEVAAAAKELLEKAQ